MSLWKTVDIACPKCGHTQETTVWTSLNVGVNPEMRQELLDGHVNVFDCQNCDTQAGIGTAMFYVDAEKELSAWYHPAVVLDDPEYLSRFAPDGQMSIPGVRDDAYPKALQRSHIVFDMQELARYIISRERLFERIPSTVKDSKLTSELARRESRWWQLWKWMRNQQEREFWTDSGREVAFDLSEVESRRHRVFRGAWSLSESC